MDPTSTTESTGKRKSEVSCFFLNLVILVQPAYKSLESGFNKNISVQLLTKNDLYN